MTIKIGDIKNVPWNKTKATFSLVLNDRIIGRVVIKDCRLIEGINAVSYTHLTLPTTPYE